MFAKNCIFFTFFNFFKIGNARVRSRKHLCLLLEINKSVPTCEGGESLTSSARTCSKNRAWEYMALRLIERQNSGPKRPAPFSINYFSNRALINQFWKIFKKNFLGGELKRVDHSFAHFYDFWGFKPKELLYRDKQTRYTTQPPIPLLSHPSIWNMGVQQSWRYNIVDACWLGHT